ncbi:MAG: hypothetical protein ACOCUJ_01545 [Thiohalospira sp.]
MSEQRDEFDAAWEDEFNEEPEEPEEGPSTGAEGEGAAGGDEGGGDREGDDTSGEGAEGDGSGEAGDGEEGDDGEGGGEEAGDDENGQAGEGEEEGDDPDTLKSELQKYEQRLKSIEGRLRATADENKELKRRLQEGGGQGGPAKPDTAKQGEAGTQNAGDDDGDGPDSDTGSQNDEVRARLTEEFGEDIANYIDKRAQEIANQQISRVDERITPLEQARQEVAAEQHRAAIEGAHPDAGEIASSKEFGQWIDSLPSYAASAARQVVEQGSAQEVVELLDQYKASRGTAAQGGQQDQKTTKPESANRARAVPSRRTTPPKAKATQDFDAAWDEF